MKTLDIIRKAGRSLRQAKVRTLLTSMAIGVGAFTIMLSLAAGEGARQYADSLIKSNVDPKALFIVKDDSITGGAQPTTGLKEYDPDVGTQDGLTIKLLNKEDIKKLELRDDITDVRPIYDVQTSYLMIEGKKKKYISEMNVYNPDVKSELSEGKLPALGTDIKLNEIVVPTSFAKTLNVSEASLIGKKVSLVSERPAKIPSEAEIQEILATKGPSGLSELGETQKKTVTLKIVALVKPSQLSFSTPSAAQIPISQAEELADFTTKGTQAYQKYFAATAKVTGDHIPEEVKKSIEKDKLYAQTAKDLQGFLFTIVNILTGVVAGFGVIALLASVFGIINTQYISVLERTSQIGLMKSLGMRSRHVNLLFLYEAAWIGFLGGLIGVLLAWGIGTALNPWITQQLDLGKETSLLVFQPQAAIGLIIGLIIVAIAAGFFPARKAAKLDPIEALRTE